MRMNKRLLVIATVRPWIALLLMLAAMPGGWSGARPAHAQGTPRSLEFFQVAGGTLDDSTPAEEWTFSGRAGQPISLIARTVSGDLDPVIEVIGPGGTAIAQNDDLDSLVRDAGLEALRLPDDGAYTVRISRWGGTGGTTRGTYSLTLTPGFARVVERYTFEQGTVSWQTPANAPVGLSAGGLRVPVNAPGQVVLALPPGDATFDEVYLQVDARLFASPSYGEFGLFFRAQGAGTQISYYALRINNQGQWTVVRHEPGSESPLMPWTAHPALTPAGVTLGALVRGSPFVFFANGQVLGQVTDTVLVGAGRLGVLAASDAGQTDSPQAMFDNALITTRLGTTYSGLPLALTTWQANNPAAIVEELAASGQIVPGPAHDLFIAEKIVTAANVLEPGTAFELLGVESTRYSDFVLAVAAGAVSTRESTACGVVFRWQDERNFTLAYVDNLGGWGLVQTLDAALATNAYDLSPMIAPSALDNLLIVAQGDRVTLYINGALVTQETVLAAEGRVGVALMNYEAARTDCYYRNIWVWPLVR